MGGCGEGGGDRRRGAARAAGAAPAPAAAATASARQGRGVAPGPRAADRRAAAARASRAQGRRAAPPAACPACQEAGEAEWRAEDAQGPEKAVASIADHRGNRQQATAPPNSVSAGRDPGAGGAGRAEPTASTGAPTASPQLFAGAASASPSPGSSGRRIRGVRAPLSRGGSLLRHPAAIVLRRFGSPTRIRAGPDAGPPT
jgi:hypothetical protein